MSIPNSDPLQSYIETARQRQRQQQLHREQRRQRALSLAPELAQLLRDEFGVSRVVLFGSVLSETEFYETSDLDLAIWDLSPAFYFKAVARLLDYSEIPIDLIEAEIAYPHIQDAIAQGIDL
jgi:predicted nucleotidyltransferase